MTNIVDFPTPDEEAARERYRAQLQIDEISIDFEKKVWDQLKQLKDVCAGFRNGALPIRIDGKPLFVPYDALFDALKDRLLSGTAIMKFDDDPEVGRVAQIIQLKRSIKPEPLLPPKPEGVTLLSPESRSQISPEEQKARRVKRATTKAERQRVFDAHVAMLRAAYGEDAAVAYALLSRKAV